jgi:hypothetical protein
MVTKKVANGLGICSVAIIASFWFLVLNPFRWNLGFLNDTIISEIAVLMALLGSIVAFFKASRWWSLSILTSLLTLLAVQHALR